MALGCYLFDPFNPFQFVEDEAMLKYQEWLKEWVAEVRERCRSFTITGSNQREDELRAQVHRSRVLIHSNPDSLYGYLVGITVRC